MNRFSICENDRVLSNPGIFVNQPVDDRAGTDWERLHILCGQLQLRTCILAAAILVGLRESGLQVLTLGALFYLPLGKLHIATSENAASTQKSECFSTETTVYHRFRSVVRSFILGGKQRAPRMSDDREIFRHVLQKRIDNAEYWREIVILEEGPFVFRVVQEVQLGLIDSTGTLKAIRPGIPNRFEWICSSKEAATEQALKCLQQSKNDNWLLSPSASSAA